MIRSRGCHSLSPFAQKKRRHRHSQHSLCVSLRLNERTNGWKDGSKRPTSPYTSFRRQLGPRALMKHQKVRRKHAHGTTRTSTPLLLVQPPITGMNTPASWGRHPKPRNRLQSSYEVHMYDKRPVDLSSQKQQPRSTGQLLHTARHQ